MKYLTSSIIPLIITSIVIFGVIEKKNVYDLFCEGAKEGVKIIMKMFPTLLGIFLVIGMFKSSSMLNFIIEFCSPILKKLNTPSEIMPLIIIRPISGSAAIAMATDIMTQHGVDSSVGKIAATIMGSSETTFYVIALYLNSMKVKRIKKVIIPAILADITTIIAAILIYNG